MADAEHVFIDVADGDCRAWYTGIVISQHVRESKCDITGATCKIQKPLDLEAGTGLLKAIGVSSGTGL